MHPNQTLRTACTTILLGLSVAGLVTGCGGSGSGGGDGGGNTVTPPTNPGTGGGFTEVPLVGSPATKVQPMTGIVFWTTHTSGLATLGDIVQLEFSYMLYSDIVSTQGNYDWSVVDDLLDDIASRGHQAILRFRYTYPGYTEISVPDYIYNAAGYNQVFASVEGQNTFIPDWTFPELETFTQQFFVDFAARYDGDPRLAVLQVGFGSYAEYHLFQGSPTLGTNFPSKDFQEVFLETMDSSFMTTQWAASISVGDSFYSPVPADSSLLDLEFGVFDDSLMHETHSDTDSEHNRSLWIALDETRYESAITGGEFNYYSAYDQANVLSPNGPWGRDFESFIDQYHLSYVIGNDQLAYQTVDRIEEAAAAMGYQFHIDSFEVSDTQSRIEISNVGVAPIYYDAYPAVDGVRATDSLKGLQPGDSMNFLIDASSANPVLSIESDHLVAGQEIGYSVDP